MSDNTTATTPVLVQSDGRTFRQEHRPTRATQASPEAQATFAQVGTEAAAAARANETASPNLELPPAPPPTSARTVRSRSNRSNVQNRTATPADEGNVITRALVKIRNNPIRTIAFLFLLAFLIAFGIFVIFAVKDRLFDQLFNSLNKSNTDSLSFQVDRHSNAWNGRAPHSKEVTSNLAPFMGAGDTQNFLDNHPLEQQARAVFEDTKNHPDLHGCYGPASDTYDPAQDLMRENPAMVPPYQQTLKELPAIRQMNLNQQFAATNIGPHAREGIDSLAPMSLDTINNEESYDFQSRVKQTEGAGVTSIYKPGDGKGISLINQKSRMTDPTKLLPRVDESRQNERMVQAGPSIADIGCRVPKAADIMKMLRASRGSALTHSIPRDKPPIYTEGLNAYRSTRLPARTFGGTATAIGINPFEVSDLVDYTPNPFLNRSKAAGQPYNYAV